jgi:kynurenine formamidase
MRAFCLLLVMLGSACATSPRQAEVRAGRIVDLTWAFDAKTLYWPNSPSAFELRQLSHGHTPGGFFYAANSFCAPEHGGTHLDAPIHFAEARRTVEEIPVESLIARAVVVDVEAQSAANPDYRLTIEDLARWEGRHGRIARGSIVLLRTGWGKRYPDRKAYFGDDRPGATDALHFPSYGMEAARILVEERGVAALGIDTASIDYGQSSDFPVHRVAAAANVVGLENLANLHLLPERGAWIIALPMKIAGGSGGPVRVVALLP